MTTELPPTDAIQGCIANSSDEDAARLPDKRTGTATDQLQALLDALKTAEALNIVRTRIIAQQEAAMVKQDARIAELEGEWQQLFDRALAAEATIKRTHNFLNGATP